MARDPDGAAGGERVRDRYVDFLRGLSILAVVVGHWSIAVVSWKGGVIRETSAVGRTPGLWLGTWLFQVMPLFFFVGGYANFVALASSARRGEAWPTFVRRRLRRLLVPAAPFFVVWAVVQVGLHWADVGAPSGPALWGRTALLRGVRPPGQTIPFGPLWFLAAYAVIVAVSPVTVWLHRRFRWWVPAAMVAGAVVTDLVGFVGGHPGVRAANIVFVLLAPHQLGHFYGDGTVARWPRRTAWTMVAVGLGGLVALTNTWLFGLFGDARFKWFPGTGHYPRSMLGTDVEHISNAYPPTLCFLLAGVWLIGLALLARPAVSRALERPALWRATAAVNLRIMTVFLWHMTAYLVAVLALWPLGFGHESSPTLRWLAERPLWLFSSGGILLVVVRVFGRFEDRGRQGPRGRPAGPDPAVTVPPSRFEPPRVPPRRAGLAS